MATRKPVKETETAEEEVLQEAEEPAKAEEPQSEWDRMEEMLVPRKPAGDEQQYYVCVNDRRWMVPANGKVQKLPYPVYCVLKESLEAQYAAEEYAENIPHSTSV